MSTPAAAIVISGTPITNQLGVGAVVGNTLQIGGLTLQPNTPGFTLVSSQAGPGNVSGVWESVTGRQRSAVSTVEGGVAPGPTGGLTGGGGSLSTFDSLPSGSQTGGMSRTGYLLLILVGLIILKGNK